MVTRCGHNKYNRIIPNLDVLIVSTARSPLKDVEAYFVGESSWLAIGSILRGQGPSPFGTKISIVGYGMIGRSVANVAKLNWIHTSVFDQDTLKLLDARSYTHEINFSLKETLNNSYIVACATGGQCISYNDILRFILVGWFRILKYRMWSMGFGQ